MATVSTSTLCMGVKGMQVSPNKSTRATGHEWMSAFHVSELNKQ